MPIFPIHVTEDSFASAAEKKIYKDALESGYFDSPERFFVSFGKNDETLFG